MGIATFRPPAGERTTDQYNETDSCVRGEIGTAANLSDELHLAPARRLAFEGQGDELHLHAIGGLGT